MSELTFMERHPEVRSLIAESGITAEDIKHAEDVVMGEYVRLDALLPPDHLWKGEKIEHAKNCANEIHEHAELFGFQGVERDVFEFLLFAHDVGRLEEAHHEGETIERVSIHGTYSVEIIQKALGMKESDLTPLWKVIFLAIKHHSDRYTVSKEELGSDAAHALLCILRDTDKLGAFDQAKEYTADEEFKARERLVSWKKQREEDPDWEKEMRIIDPPHLLWESFLHGRLPDRASCRSYEAHMLQLLSWVYDVNTPEILQIIIQKGGAKIVFEYLISQLTKGSQELPLLADRDEAVHQIEALKKWAGEWGEGVLAA